MKKINNYIPNLLVSIVLVFAVLVTGVILFAKGRLMNPETYINSAEKANVNGLVMAEIEEYFENSENYSRIPADVYMSAVSEDMIEDMIDNRIENVFDYMSGENSEISAPDADFASLEESITEYFEKFAEENNVEVDEAYNTQLENTISTAEEEIIGFTDIYMLDVIGKTNAFEKAGELWNFVGIAEIASFVLLLICISLILIFSRKQLRYALYWTSASIICSSVLGILPVIYIKLSGTVDKLIIGTPYIYKAVTRLMNDCINSYFVIQTCLLGLGIVFMAIFCIISKRKKA